MSPEETEDPTKPRSQRLALLLTDVVDSTKLSQSLGDAATARLWADHDRVARDLLTPHRGREIDKTDGFLLLFDDAAAAVAYAMAYHRAIGAFDPPLKARAGLHVGPVILTENAPADVARGAKPLEVDGLAKPTAARVMGLATGGQTLLTSEAKAALGHTDLRVESHGFWRMKGVSEPVELFEVGGPDAPFTPPPDAAKVYRVVRQGELWLPAREVHHNLPTERDAFVGRHSDLHDLARLLDDGAHLVSVLGMGGTGKTRLVTRYAWAWLGDWPGGAWFCDLSEARTLEGIAFAVARGLDVPLGKDDVVAQLGHAIAGRGRCLVVLDNFEQVARHAPETLGRWLDRASEASFVVTTREVLGLPGETALALAPLVTPEGVDLFVARAVQAKRDFVPSDRASIEALVRLLDGLPLAIELAAARVRVLTPKLLLERMSERFKLLASAGGRHTRQATLRGALDWSWDLLTPDEQQALAQLSVFEGGFGLESAEVVLSLASAWPVDAVQALLDKSLVRRVSDERLDLLVSVAEYAAEKLRAMGGAAARDAEVRHGEHFAALGSDAAIAALDTFGGTERRLALQVDLDNLVTACRRAVGRGAGEVAVPTFVAAFQVMSMTGPLSAAVALGTAAAQLPDLAPQVRARLLMSLGRACVAAGRMDEARARFDEAEALCRARGDARGEAVASVAVGTLLDRLSRPDEARARYEAGLVVARRLRDRFLEGRIMGSLGDLNSKQARGDEARRCFEFSLAVAREVGDRAHEGSMTSNLGLAHEVEGRLEAAAAAYEAGIAIHREVGNRRFEGLVLNSLANLIMDRGNTDEALAMYEASLAIHRAVGNRQSEGVVLGNLGSVHRSLGRLDEAQRDFEVSNAILHEVGNRRFEAVGLLNLADLHLDRGRQDEARRCIEAALPITREIGDPRGEAFAMNSLGTLSARQGRFDQAREALTAAEQLFRASGDLMSLGTSHLRRSECERLAGDLEEAAARLEAAEGVLRELGLGPDSDLGRSIERAWAAHRGA